MQSNNDNPFKDLVPQQTQDAAPQQQGSQVGAQQATESPFSDLVPNNKQQNSPINNTPKDPGAFMAAVDGFNRSFARQAEGALQALSPILPASFNQANANVHNQKEQEVALDQIQHPIATTVGEGAGYGSQFLALPTGKSAVARALINTTGGVALGANQYGSLEDRARQGLLGGVLGLGGSVVGELAGKGLGVLTSTSKEPGMLTKIFRPEDAATAHLSEEISRNGGIDAVNERSAAANRLNTWLSPAETLGGNAKTVEQKMSVTPGEQSQISQALTSREADLKSQTQKMINNFVPEGEDVAKETQAKLYKSIEPLHITDDSSNVLKSNPIINNALQEVNKNPLLPDSVKTAPDTSVVKLDQVKRDIDRQLYNNKSVLSNQDVPMDPAERQTLMNARNTIVDQVDAQHPEYAAARQVSERLIMKQSMLNDIKTIRPAPQAMPGEVTLDQMYNKLFPNPAKQDNFLSAVQRSGGDVQNAQDIMQVMNQVRKTPLNTLIGKPATFEDSVSSLAHGEGVTGKVVDFLTNLGKGEYNKALINLTLSGPKWQQKVSETLSKENPIPKFMGLKNILDKVKSAKNSLFNDIIPNSVKAPDNLDIHKMSMEPQPHMDPNDYMAAERAQAAAEQANAQKYHVGSGYLHPSEAAMQGQDVPQQVQRGMLNK